MKKKVAVIADSNSGITQKEAGELGVFVLPMPFIIDGKSYFEGVDLTYEEFYQKQINGSDIRTSQPAVGDINELWDKVLLEYDEIVYIPMSSGLSSSCETATMISNDYDGKVQVVNNQRISVTQKASVWDAIELIKMGKSALDVKTILEDRKFDSSIYITLETLSYLKKGGRITSTAAAIGEFLKIKPVLQIQGEKLDAFAKARTKKQAKKLMLNAIQQDIEQRFKISSDGMNIMLAYSTSEEEIKEFYEEVKALYPNHNIIMDPLSLSITCHIGPGAIGYACAKKLEGTGMNFNSAHDNTNELVGVQESYNNI